MNADIHLALCESLARATRQMREAAERADWDTLVAGGDKCAELVERLRSEPTPRLDQASLQRKAGLLKAMLADDREIREHTQPEVARLSALLGIGRRAAEAAAKYRY